MGGYEHPIRHKVNSRIRRLGRNGPFPKKESKTRVTWLIMKKGSKESYAG